MGANIDECKLNRFLKSQAWDLIMFSWVESVRVNYPTVKRRDAILQFINHFGIDADIKCLETTYERMLKKLIESEKS